MRRIFPLFVLFHLLLSIDGQAQSRKVLKSSYERSEAANFLLQAEGLEKEDPAKAIDLVQAALKEAIKIKDAKVEAESYFLLGNINKNSNQFDIAIDYYTKAKLIFKRENIAEGTYKTIRALAEAYKGNRNYDLALSEYDTFLALAEKKANTLDQIETHQSRAAIFKLQSKLDESLQELNKAEKLTQILIVNEPKLSEVKLQKGEVYEAQSNDVEALNQYEQSAVLSNSVRDKRGVLNSNNKISRLFSRQGKKKEAVQKQKENLLLFDKNGIEPQIEMEADNIAPTPVKTLEERNETEVPLNVIDETRANLDLAKSYIELDSSSEAIAYLKTAIDKSSESGAISEEKEAYGLLSEAYSNAGNNIEALKSYKNYVSLVDSLYKLKEADILASLDLNNELSKRLQRITSLEKDRSLQEKTIELLESERLAEEARNKQLKVIVYSLIIGLLLMLLLIYFMNKNSKQKRLSNQLLALKNLRTQMNPHFIFNALNSVNNFISQSDERSANRYLSDFSRLMRLVLENSEHDFISLSKEIDILKLYVGLEHSRFSEKFDYTIDIADSLDVDKYEIPPMMVQPYIENAVWHGLRYLNDKGQLKLEIKEQNDQLHILIEDNGIGRKKSLEMKTENQKSTKSTAMKNIDERMKIMNKIHGKDIELKVSDLNADGSGTKVTITIPAKN